MIFYFSATGNSQLIAQTIAHNCNMNYQSLTPFLKDGKKQKINSQTPLIFVTPIYAWRIPRVVEKWIENAEFNGNNQVYFVCSCGGSVGNADHFLRKLCKKKKWDYMGLAEIKMPENYLLLFDTPSQKECEQIIKNAITQVDKLTSILRDNKKLPSLKLSAMDKLNSSFINPLFYSFAISDKSFQVSDACIHCGKCAQRCPINNIELIQNKPSWNHHCTHCMACIAGCPTKAIFTSKSANRNHPFILDDIHNQKIGGKIDETHYSY